MRYGERAEEITVAVSPGVEEEAHLREVLHSAAFRKAPIATALLLYLWRHRSEAVSEYALATEALGRKPDFDPKVDATVRVQISRLRQKLKDFYDTDGKDSALRIAIPLGGHELAVLRSSAAVPSPRRIPWNAFLAAACVLLLAACALLYRNNRTLSAAIQASKSARHQPRFWRSFFANGRPTSVFLPMPVFFEWPSTNLKIRDPRVNDFANFSTSDELQAHTKRFGPPRLLQNYTVASDTFAALNLMQYLQGKGLDLAFGSTAELSLDFFRDHNIIIFGTPGTSRYVKQLMEKTNFFTVPGETRVVRNRIRAKPTGMKGSPSPTPASNIPAS